MSNFVCDAVFCCGRFTTYVKVQLFRLRIQTYCMIVNRTTAYWFTKNLWPYRKSCYCHWRTFRWTDTSSSDRSHNSVPSFNRNYSLTETNGDPLSILPERETLTEPAREGSIFASCSGSYSTDLSQLYRHVHEFGRSW